MDDGADPVRGAVAERPAYRGMTYFSHYLTMRDGVRIAVDVYLPAGVAGGAELPAILHQTRYYRSMELRWPWRLFLRGQPFDHTGLYARRRRRFVTSGYAWVDVDVRGSGASYGTRAVRMVARRGARRGRGRRLDRAPALVQRPGRRAGDLLRRQRGGVPARQPASRRARHRAALRALRRLHRHRLSGRDPRHLVHRELGAPQRLPRPQRPARGGRLVGEARGDRRTAGAGRS